MRISCSRGLRLDHGHGWERRRAAEPSGVLSIVRSIISASVMLSEIVKRSSWVFAYAKPLLVRRETKALCVIWVVAAGLHIRIGHYNAIEVALLALIVIPVGTIASVLVWVVAAFAIKGRQKLQGTPDAKPYDVSDSIPVVASVLTWVLMLLWFDGQVDRYPRSLRATLLDLGYVLFGLSVFATACAAVVAAFLISLRTLVRLFPLDELSPFAVLYVYWAYIFAAFVMASPVAFVVTRVMQMIFGT